MRELENMLERALAMCDGKTITIDDVLNEDAFKSNGVQKPSFDLDQTREVSLSDYLEDIEKRAIIKALDTAKNNKTAAAKLLGISFRTLRYRLAKLGLAKDEDADLESEAEDH